MSEDSMDKFLINLFSEERIEPPGPCLDALSRHFPNAVRTDWSSKDQLFEAVFYMENLEHIARYNADGDLQDYMVHLSHEMLPASIRSDLKGRGEIMSTVLLNNRYSISYEVIIRDVQLKRHLILLSFNGTVLGERTL